MQPTEQRRTGDCGLPSCAGHAGNAAAAHAGPTQRALAQLLIHTGGEAADGRGASGSLLGRLRGWARAVASGRPPAPTGLGVADLEGRQYFAIDHVPAVVELSLPAGTYHVALHRGDQRSRYTVTLEQGATSELDLRGTVGRR